ncbi:2OG-Fe(II) oxygenase [Umboniibacter marinipuniceus]|uniref:2-oxoglutarate-Fe(II)-dependent oxygenase superfamily protein n=1 Tax=Umboniibacter marinipuniceus TaxID=569599 RepID=A0A3M0A5A0_9GAMM|nr:2OG-Fe(II) oxygenase [Umboniibacter marinipuniceus]RMA77645.1 2-oxoglutarate-Fe(II)-dependent oxygenase superfamily protein [Umboniibacter marinipuniceus]
MSPPIIMTEHFITKFQNLLSPEECADVITLFEGSSAHHPGRTGSGVDPSKKNSLDLNITKLEAWKPYRQVIEQRVMAALANYVRSYPHLVTGAVAPSIIDPQTSQPRSITASELTALNDQTLSQIVHKIFRLDGFNMQRYSPQVGGYHHWHSEQFPHPNDSAQRSLHRVLLVLIYLNDVTDGGATEFIHQQVAIQPEAGSLLLAPCGFTHTHRGLRSATQTKYVLASWVMYQPAELLYAS